MDKKYIEFCELLCAKFCHDLSGPIGAINNGIDFLDSDNESMRAKAADLVKLSSNQAVNRLSFYRQAYGSIPFNSEIGLLYLKGLVLKYIQDSKLTFKIEHEDNQDHYLSHELAKVILNLIIIASNTILLNGALSLKFDQFDKPTKIYINATGSTAKVNDELVEILSSNFDHVPMTTRNIQQFYTAFLIKNLGISVNINNTKTDIQIILSM